MDLSFYSIGEAMYRTGQQDQAHGYLTGSGLPTPYFPSFTNQGRNQSCGLSFAK